MTNSSTDAAKLQAQLVEVYSKLTASRQKIVQVLSVISEPVNRAWLMDCCNQLGIRHTNNQPFNNATFKPCIDQLLDVGVLLQDRGQAPQCHPLLKEIATREAVRSGWFETVVDVIEKKLPIYVYGNSKSRRFSSAEQLIREVRIGIYRQDIAFINQQLDDYSKCTYLKNQPQITIDEIFLQVCNTPFDPDWFDTLSQEFYESGLSSILTNSMLKLVPEPEPFALLQTSCLNQGKRSCDYLTLLFTEQLLMRGRVQEAQQSLERLSDQYHDEAMVFQGWLSCLRGEYETAIAHYTTALKILKKNTGKRQIYFSTVSGLFFILALLKDGSSERLQEAEGYTNVMVSQSTHWLRVTYARLQSVLKFQRGDLAQKEFVVKATITDAAIHHSFETLLCSLCLYWVDPDHAKQHLPKILEPFYQQAEAAGYSWLAMEAAELLLRLKPRSSYGKQAAEWRTDHGISTLVDLIRPQESWELCLKALTQLNQELQVAPTSEAKQRLAWFITFYSTGCMLQPREQTITAKGVWGKGRNIALKRLNKNLEDFNYFTPQDRRVCAHLKAYNYGYYGQIDYTFSEKAIASLVGHPLVFWEDSPTTRIDIVKGEPELIVKQGKGGRLTLQLSPEIKDKQEILVVKESPTRLKVIDIKAEHQRIADIIGKHNRLDVPAAAKERVLAAITAVSGMLTVHSDIGGGMSSATEVIADTKPHIHLLPAGEGLKVALLSRPFAHGGSYYRPGAGGKTVIAEIDGKRLQTTRNLSEEKKLANAVLAACPTLIQQEERDGEWLVDDPEACLELLLELQALEDNVVMEWPEGEKLRVNYHASLKDFHLTIQRQRDWFSADGELKLDDTLMLDMQRLMELLEQTPSRFVPLGNGQFLALTQEFRKRLDELRTFSEKQGKGLRFHPFAALALEEFVNEVGDLKADKHWKAHIQKIKEMQTFQPELPSTLQAELRDYQIDGFHWLARLAHWGVGACLADDMGLGKTLQALALILTRASAGATLIVAPTSVCMNWISEVQRFAPTLRVIQLGSGDRQKVLDALQPFDMLICSYGLLQQEEVADLLSKVQWQTIVLDEAQAIKNTATKRSQAAMSLQGGFKLITTGTPIENHLGELWNLFRFINPGLLGSLDSFNQRFANPIERFQDKQARNQLKKLIQPFLLRRTKSQVLEELPSRTEIVLHVDLSPEELAFYEALRRDAIAKLSASDAAPGQKHLQVLAEIMKLRRACCNTRLVMPEVPLPSSKLQLFGEVLDELLENHHKALVFSQFVDHLHIIRAYLDEHKIQYQYLDGSTPAAERKKRVDAFQSGTGDVFLISLKAGGTGLNLTAADYVIHMDPWWNPAVEDQASDRAHRFGQHRPVTIYRLVAKNTIEEKIVDLHHHKRDLADSLLEGSDMGGKISTEALLQLIHASD
jgi:SNF2 family DNA or RNA helicase